MGLAVALLVGGCGASGGADRGGVPLGGESELVSAESGQADGAPGDPAAVAGPTPATTGTAGTAAERAGQAATPAVGQPPRRPKVVRDQGAPIRKDLPPPMPQPSPTDCRPTYVGPQATRAEVKAVLTDAAGRVYLPVSAPHLRVPLDLIKAVAWQESGWQSNIVACDGGVGLMQVMPATADWMNEIFDESYDLHDYRDNAPLGANYLAWLIRFFADSYFGGAYALTAADCAGSTDHCLLNLVIAAYNYGPYAVDTDQGLVIPNPQYVRNVRALMTECVCLSF
ncbi:lytic transglycosylase domain-containing protein [Solwaraspora sp. WMMD1047]|uniref:lytic transglycosylase domain-containing protein n=1 Tax=Solwaraspora sp. WMMD1047 TaxID=3016102 RepID=UPI00241716FC|nr:lytic transglycosylase domain-containing protein [Solwaraspora sp. WMMD1047]MDG4831888.1 lytic transglycosylase domain-containing protein [Solwaraspora sp. WMMD1047]